MGSGSGKVLSLVASAEDVDVVRAAQRGDQRALGILYDRHAPRLQRIIKRILGADSESADALQDAFLSIFRHLPNLREPERFRAWSTSVALNAVRGRLRRRKTRRWLSFRGDEVPEVPTRTDHGPREALRRVMDLLQRLPVDERIAFSLIHLEDMPLEDAAEACEMSLSTFKRRLRRGRERLESLARQDPSLRAFVTPSDAPPHEASQ